MAKRKRRRTDQIDLVHRSGLSPVQTTNMRHARRVIHQNIESTAIHSASKGWQPRIKVDLTHVPLIGPGAQQVTEIVWSPEDLAEFVRIAGQAMMAAHLDVRTGIREQNGGGVTPV